jgi:hypothetical protein
MQQKYRSAEGKKAVRVSSVNSSTYVVGVLGGKLSPQSFRQSADFVRPVND